MSDPALCLGCGKPLTSGGYCSHLCGAPRQVPDLSYAPGETVVNLYDGARRRGYEEGLRAAQSNDPAPLPGLQGFDVGWRAALDAVSDLCTALAVDNENPAARRAYVFVCQKLPTLTPLGPVSAASPSGPEGQEDDRE